MIAAKEYTCLSVETDGFTKSDRFRLFKNSRNEFDFALRYRGLWHPDASTAFRGSTCM